MAILSTLPRELTAQIVSYLIPSDLLSLTTVCKSLGDAAVPLLWRDIEIHAPGEHVDNSNNKKMAHRLPPETVAPESRVYLGNRQYDYPGGRESRARQLFCLLDALARGTLQPPASLAPPEPDPESSTESGPGPSSAAQAPSTTSPSPSHRRFRLLASRIRSLCFEVLYFGRTKTEYPNPIPWPEVLFYLHLLPHFARLQRLEIYGATVYKTAQFSDAQPSLEPLPTLRHARLWAYLPATVARYVLKSWRTLETLELGLLDEPRSQGDARIYSDNDDDDEIDEDYEEDNGEGNAPAPLGLDLKTMTPQLSLPRLRYLHLAKPSQCDPAYYAQWRSGPNWDDIADARSRSDWFVLLEAASASLETLAVEHRATAEYIEGDGLSEEEFITLAVGGPAQHNLTLLLQDVFSRKEFPKLKRVYLYGIFMNDEVPASLKEVWDGMGVKYTAHLGRWT